MNRINLVNQKLKDLFFKTTINQPNAGKIEIEIRYEYSMDYITDNRHAIAHLKYTVQSKDYPDSFKLIVGYDGVIEANSIEKDDEKKAVYVSAYYLLFPFVQAMISQTVVAAGFPQLQFPAAEMVPENVEIKNNMNE